MNKTFFYIVLLLCVIGLRLNAQELSDSVALRVHYASQMRYYEDSKDLSPDEKILDVGKHSSHFYSRWAERNQDILDSVSAKGGSLSDHSAVVAKSGFPNSKTPFNVFKNYPRKDRLTYTTREIKDFLCEEPMTMPKWEMLSGDTIIVDYPCKKTKTSFRGRTWIVWYTMDIPYHDGPWKLYGLPGLILKADDAKGDFTFNCTGIEKGNMQPIALRKSKYIKCTPQVLEENIRLSHSDVDLFMTKMGYPNIQGFDATGKSMVHKSRIPCLLEYLSEKKQ